MVLDFNEQDKPGLKTGIPRRRLDWHKFAQLCSIAATLLPDKRLIVGALVVFAVLHYGPEARAWLRKLRRQNRRKGGRGARRAA